MILSVQICREPLWAPYFLNVFQSGTHAAEQGVCHSESSHGLYHHHRPGNDHRIVASLDFNFRLLSGAGHSFLRGCNGWGGLKGCAQNQVTAVADAAQYAAGMIGQLDNFPVCVQ